MDARSLTNIGLTLPQAKAYMALIKHGPATPFALAKKIRESRSNTYKILDRLIELGLVHRRDEHKKFVYYPESPLALETMAQKARHAAHAHEKHVRDTMPALLSHFYTYANQPGVRFFQGRHGLMEVFSDMLRTGEPIYLLRSPSDVRFYDEAFFASFRKERAKLDIATYALTPKVASAVHNPDVDKANKFSRTWLAADAYTAPVEWNIYGNKVALISYGKEAVATIIESPQIAESFRQVFQLVQKAFDGASAPK